MSKIKIFGYTELIDVNEDIARKIKDWWLDESISNDEKLDISNGIAVTKRDIRAIIPERELSSNDQYQEQMRDYYTNREKIMELSPQDKAKQCAWDHFSLFFQGVYDRKPNIDRKDLVIQWAEDFYQKNPEWTKPSMKLWITRLKLEKDFKMDAIILRTLEISEERELRDIADRRTISDIYQ